MGGIEQGGGLRLLKKNHSPVPKFSDSKFKVGYLADIVSEVNL
jgi:hypothetical protein